VQQECNSKENCYVSNVMLIYCRLNAKTKKMRMELTQMTQKLSKMRC